MKWFKRKLPPQKAVVVTDLKIEKSSPWGDPLKFKSSVQITLPNGKDMYGVNLSDALTQEILAVAEEEIRQQLIQSLEQPHPEPMRND